MFTMVTLPGTGSGMKAANKYSQVIARYGRRAVSEICRFSAAHGVARQNAAS